MEEGSGLEGNTVSQTWTMRMSLQRLMLHLQPANVQNGHFAKKFGQKHLRNGMASVLVFMFCVVVYDQCH